VRANVGSGDGGMTSLLSGERVPKSHARIEACGELDELASVLGALGASLADDQEPIRAEIRQVQGELLHVGAWLAATPGSQTLSLLKPPSQAPVDELERGIERMEKDLPPLQGFILPGGHPSAAWAHLARCVCRRAERRAAAVPSPEVLPWLNRLSSYLYVVARHCNHSRGVPESLWKV
jgi:cob(I)alamin adenosyltransferase